MDQLLLYALLKLNLAFRRLVLFQESDNMPVLSGHNIIVT